MKRRVEKGLFQKKIKKSYDIGKHQIEHIEWSDLKGVYFRNTYGVNSASECTPVALSEAENVVGFLPPVLNNE